jgi:hypothetical protein
MLWLMLRMLLARLRHVPFFIFLVHCSQLSNAAKSDLFPLRVPSEFEFPNENKTEMRGAPLGLPVFFKMKGSRCKGANRLGEARLGWSHSTALLSV